MSVLTWKILVDFGAGYVDIASKCAPEHHRTESLHNRLAPTINTFDFTITDKATANQLLSASPYVPAKVWWNRIETSGTFTAGNAVVTAIPSTTNMTAGDSVSGPRIKPGTTIQSVDSGTQITLSKTAIASGTASQLIVDTAAVYFDFFVGVMRANFKGAIGSVFKSMPAQIVDKSILLKKKITTSINFSGKALSNPSDKPNSVMHQLFLAAGFIDAEMSFAAVTDVLYFAVESSDNISFEDVLQQIEKEYGWVHQVGNDGIARIYDLFPTSYTPTTLNDSMLLGEAIIERVEYLQDQVRIKYSPVETKTGIIVFSDTTGGDDTHKCTINLDASEHYPENAGTFAVFADFSVENYEVLYATNAALAITQTNVTTVTFTPSYKRAQVDLQAGAGGGRITKFDIVADAVLINKNIQNTVLSYIASSTSRIEDIATKYVHDATAALRLANGRGKYYTYACFTYKFQSDYTFALNEYRTLSEAIMGISTDVRVVQILTDQHGIRQVTCEGMSAYTVVAGTSTGTFTPTTEQPEQGHRFQPAQIRLNQNGYIGMLIPLYIYPTGGGIETNFAAVIEMARQYPNVTLYVVVNPSSGPGSSADGNYTDAIKKLRAARIYTLGYIATGFPTGVGVGKSIATVQGEISTWLSLYPMIDGIFLDQVPYVSPLTEYVRDYFKAVKTFAIQQGMVVDIGNPGCAVGADYYDNNLFDITVIHEGNHWPTEAEISTYTYNTDYDKNCRAVLCYGATVWDAESFKMCMKWVGTLYCDDGSAGTAYTFLSVHLEEQFILINNRTTQLAFEGSDAANDHRLPDLCELWDMQMPDLVSHGSAASHMPTVRTGGVVFEPSQIGATDNPRVFWADRNCHWIGKASTNSVDHGDCTDSANAPHITGITPTAPASCTFNHWIGRLALDGFNCREISKLGAVGTTAVVFLDDESGLYGFSAGNTITMSVMCYIPTGAISALTSCVLWIYDYQAGWAGTSINASTGGGAFDKWFVLSVTRTLRASATKIGFELQIASAEAQSKYYYVRNIMVSATAYQVPFTPGTRAAGALAYAYQLASAGELEFALRPYFNYDCAGYHIFLDFGTVGGQNVSIFYNYSSDKIEVSVWKDASNYKRLETAQLNAGSLNAAMMIRYKWDFAANSMSAWENETAMTEPAILGSAGSLAGIALAATAYVGYDPTTAGREADSLLADLAINPTAAALITAQHYTIARPYYDPHELTNENRNYRIGILTARQHDIPTYWSDRYGRMAKADAEGFAVYDACGKVLFQTPDAALVDASYPLGQIFGEKYDNAVYTLLNSTTFTQSSWTTLTIVTNGVTNLRGVWIKYYLLGVGNAAASPEIIFFLRPTGTSWGDTVTDMSPGEGVFIGQNGAYTTSIAKRGLVYVPIVGNQFDYFAAVVPSGTSRQLTIQQIGKLV
jgi:hypothetical protein